MKPQRIRLRRTKGWKMPANTVKVDRSTVFGNISTCGWPHMCAMRPCDCCPTENPQGWCCVVSFREYVLSGIENRPCRSGALRYVMDHMANYPHRAKMIERLPLLRGKNLACWCRLCDQHRDGKPLGVECSECAPCHADVLLGLANDECTNSSTD